MVVAIKGCKEIQNILLSLSYSFLLFQLIYFSNTRIYFAYCAHCGYQDFQLVFKRYFSLKVIDCFSNSYTIMLHGLLGVILFMSI